MKKLCVFTLYDEKGASSRYRVLMYKTELEKHFETKVFCFWSNEYITKYTFNKKKYALIIFAEYIKNFFMRLFQLYFIASKSDVVFIQKGVIPGVRSTHLKHLKRKNIRIIYDVDDAIYLNPRNNTDKIAKVSDAVICGNDTLKEHYTQINRNCSVIPTVEDTRMFKPYWQDTFQDKVIGWIGSGVTLHNLDLVMDALNIVVDKHPEVKFHIICNTAGDYLNKIKNSVFIKWELESYIPEMSKFTIGIMPLKDIKINRGKCGFKLIQCLNMKKPVVATDLGVNKEIVDSCGLLAETTSDWVEAIEKLLFDSEKYNDCIDQIDLSFFAKYDFNLIADRLIQIIDQ